MRSNLKSLYLGWNSIGDEGCIVLSKKLPRPGVKFINGLSLVNFFLFYSDKHFVYLTFRELGNCFSK